MAIKMKELEKVLEGMITDAIIARQAAAKKGHASEEAYQLGKRDALQTILWAGLRG